VHGLERSDAVLDQALRARMLKRTRAVAERAVMPQQQRTYLVHLRIWRYEITCDASGFNCAVHFA
jgi:hypothetical protein